MALFHALEENIPRTGLDKYDNFIISLFGGRANSLEDVFSEADCHVLSFNYDRLFEIAFLNHFNHHDPGQFGLYSTNVLNSGFNRGKNGVFDAVKPAAGRFNFLKLHGSLGWWVRKEQSSAPERLYRATSPNTRVTLQDIEALATNAPDELAWKPLLAFPHERQSSRKFYQESKKSAGYHWAPYIDAVWNYAGDLVAEATEVKVIGYSFDQNDSRYMVEELLSKVPASLKIVLKHKKEAEADVMRKVEGYKALRGRVEFDPASF